MYGSLSQDHQGRRNRAEAAYYGLPEATKPQIVAKWSVLQIEHEFGIAGSGAGRWILRRWFRGGVVPDSPKAVLSF